MSITYSEMNGIGYPDIKVSGNHKPISQLGKYGRMALNYLKAVKPHRVLEMKINGTLNETFYQVDKEATEMMITLRKQLLEKNPTPNPNDYMKTVQHRNMIRAQAEEIPFIL